MSENQSQAFEPASCPHCGLMVRPCTRRVCLSNCAGAVHESDGSHACPPTGPGTRDGDTMATLPAAAKLVTDVKVGDRIGSLGYVTEIKLSHGLDLDRVMRDYVTLTLRSKPFSPTGLPRGVANGTLALLATDEVSIGSAS